MTRYFALLDGKKGAYGIAFPDIPGCVAMGETVDEAFSNAIVALRDVISETRVQGGAVPEPRSLEELSRDMETLMMLASGEFMSLIAVPVVIDSGQPAKANLSLDSGLLEAIDAAAAEAGLTRSKFLASAAREKIEGRHRLKASA
jgi:predicted RNase H-like HicB family nuclease